MLYPEKEIVLKDGRRCVVRCPDPERDAPALIAVLRGILAETPYLMREPEEFDMGPEREAAFLRRTCQSPDALMLLAEVEGRIAGICDVHRSGSLRLRHRCEVSVSLYRAFWGLGIGTALLGELLAAAEGWGCEQAELEVVTANRRAIGLYRKMGFAPCGVRPRVLKYRDGSYADVQIMVKWLPRSNSPSTSQT